MSGRESISHISARLTLDAFESFQADFKAITRRAKLRFEQRDWHAGRLDAIERLELYKKVIDRVVSQLHEVLCADCKQIELWSEMKAAYSSYITGRGDAELAKTFFNSVTRRIFTTIGVDDRIEFVGADFEPPSNAPVSQAGPAIFKAYNFPGEGNGSSLQGMIQAMLDDFQFTIGYQDIVRDAQQVASEIRPQVLSQAGQASAERVELLKPVFYRDNYAFLIGRIVMSQRERHFVPLAIALVSTPTGVRVDAVLLDEDEVSIVFSFAHSYFHVEVEHPAELVHFLKSIIPLKRIAELYISIGYNKHGKTELYYELMRHLANSADRFEFARGEKGMVMIVFTLPSIDIVFKVIKDRVTPPKATSRAEVMERYALVFRHDRVGRLVDAQEFEYLRFERERFSQALLDELLEYAPEVVWQEDGWVVIKHLYTERRLTPLNLFIQEAPSAANAVLDYGQAIKELAAANIFPGDILLKNFGVTRHGRVVFYDYDELCLVTDCKFRRLPPSRNTDDEMDSEPWFFVGALDIFPVEFQTFLGLPEPLRSVFIQAHHDLFEVEFWQAIQNKHKLGEVLETFPYPSGKRYLV